MNNDFDPSVMSNHNAVHEPALVTQINTEDFLQEMAGFLDEKPLLTDIENLETFMPITPMNFEPEHWTRFPTLENVDSKYEFDISIDRGESQNWLYHSLKRKAFIKINSVMNVNISYMPFDNSIESLYLRCMILFSSPDDMHLPVKRCAHHRTLNDNGIPPFHILKCCHPQTKYLGEENLQVFGQRTSLLVPLSKPRIYATEPYNESIGLQFLCQNSCTTGINRKPTVVVFTLENSNFEIVGRKVMHFKVCSCPKRDMMQEEKIMSKKRDASSEPHSSRKRPTVMVSIPNIKIETSSMPTPIIQENPTTQAIEDSPVTIKLTMPNKSSAEHVLRCALNEFNSVMPKDHPDYHKYAKQFEYNFF